MPALRLRTITLGVPLLHSGYTRRTGNVLAGMASGHMSSRNVGAVSLVILLGLVEPDLYTVGVLILTLGGVGAAALAGEYLIRFLRAHLRSDD